MRHIGDIPLFDAADYLETPRDCAKFLLHLIQDGNEDDVRRRLNAVARATGQPIGDLPREIVAHVLGGDPARAVAARTMMDRLGVGTGGHPVSPA